VEHRELVAQRDELERDGLGRTQEGQGGVNQRKEDRTHVEPSLISCRESAKSTRRTGFLPPTAGGVCVNLGDWLREGGRSWYHCGMTTVTKLAISLPTKTAATLEKLRAKKRLTRSAAITEAVDQWIAAQQLDEADRKYVEGYLHNPEKSQDSSGTAKGATAGWEPWE
jgi:hypothetical protein